MLATSGYLTARISRQAQIADLEREEPIKLEERPTKRVKKEPSASTFYIAGEVVDLT